MNLKEQLIHKQQIYTELIEIIEDSRYLISNTNNRYSEEYVEGFNKSFDTYLEYLIAVEQDLERQIISLSV